MEPYVNPRADSICRACLSGGTEMRPLFEKMEGDDRTLFEVLCFVANISVSSSNKFPQQVCNECFVILCKSDEFKKKCLKSDNVLKVMFDNCKVKNSNGVKVETEKPSLEPYQCTFCFEKFMTCDQLDSHMLSHYCVKETSKTLDSINLSLGGVECYESAATDLSKPYEVKEEAELAAADFTDYFDVNDSFNEPFEYKEEKFFECHCGTSFIDEQEYTTHTNSCTKKEKKVSSHSSSKTSKKLSSETKVKKVIKYTPKKKEICLKCDASFSSLKSLRLHQKDVHKDETTEIYQCTTCMRSFLRKNSYLSHIKMHEMKDNLKFVCNTCKREFQHQAHLDNHILAVHTRDEGYGCEICNISFTTQECLDIHKTTHNVEKKHQCKLCNKAFQMLSTLTEHMRIHTGERPHLCSICGRGFTQKNNLEQHVRRHKGLKPFKCEACERRFVSKGELVAHARKHSGAHPFVCDDCGKGFTTSSSLVKHRRIHTGERPYACDLCNMRFSASGTLKNHRRTHTGEKPYQCSHCEKAFVQRQDLVSHIRCHTGERPYVCANCGQAFRKASALKTHVKVHVKDGAGLSLSTLQDVNALLGRHVS